MILELDKLSDDTERIVVDEVLSFEDVDGNENQIDCHIELSVRKIAESYYIHTDLKGRFSTPCHKCLEPTECNVNSSFELVVKKAVPASSKSTPDDDAGDEGLVYLPAGENELVLDQTIYENLISDIPIQICCREDCRGLCPSCGAKLNDGPCSCEPETDSRWDALRALKKSEDAPSE